MRSRDTVRVTSSLESKLCAYATAACAAGVGITMFALPAEGRVIYTPADQLIKTHQEFRLDLNHDGSAEFVIHNFRSCTDFCCTNVEVSPVIPSAGTHVAGFKTFIGTYPAYAFNAGARIGSSRQFLGKLMATIGGCYGNSGQWLNVRNRYLGLEFQINGKTRYGWARLNVHVTPASRLRVKLTGYAYETMASKAIVAGDTGAATIQPATLGHLALGTSGSKQH